MKFHIVVFDFRNKLPRPQNQAKTLTDEEKVKIFGTKESSLKFMSFINVAAHKVSLSETDIDEFYNQLNNFDYNFILFKKYYKQYINNLNRLNPIAENKNFELAVLQKALELDKLRPTKPFPILWHHIKYRYKITSTLYELYWRRKRN